MTPTWCCNDFPLSLWCCSHAQHFIYINLIHVNIAGNKLPNTQTKSNIKVPHEHAPVDLWLSSVTIWILAFQPFQLHKWKVTDAKLVVLDHFLKSLVSVWWHNVDKHEEHERKYKSRLLIQTSEALLCQNVAHRQIFLPLSRSSGITSFSTLCLSYWRMVKTWLISTHTKQVEKLPICDNCSCAWNQPDLDTHFYGFLEMITQKTELEVFGKEE